MIISAVSNEANQKISKDQIFKSSESIVHLTNIPETFFETIDSKQRGKWKQSKQSEINSLLENKTWNLQNLHKLPKGAKIIPCKQCVFYLKKKS